MCIYVFLVAVVCAYMYEICFYVKCTIYVVCYLCVYVSMNGAKGELYQLIEICQFSLFF